MSNKYNCNNGFTFLEAMVALLVLVVCLTSLGPILGRVSSERGSIRQTETALSLLNNQLTQWSAGSSELPANLNLNNVYYNLDWKKVDAQTMQLCVVWKNSAERDKTICGKIKR